jgi:hypothetical protein
MLDWLTKLTRKPGAKRAEERTETRLPVRIDNRQAGFTRDMSASGAYLETDLEYRVGSAIEFVIEFQGPDGSTTRMDCFGRIVRVEPRGGGKVGIAVKISQRNLKAPER